jgi:hypothetical protein
MSGLAVKNYWLKEIDVYRFLSFNFGYTKYISFLCLISVIYFVITAIVKYSRQFLIFPLLCVIVTLVPYLYSVLRMPILVDRYAMILGPVFFLMLAISIIELMSFVSRKAFSFALMIVLILFSIQGFWMSFINPEPLKKQPWREMANWLINQADYKETPVYSQGSMIKGFFNLDFYLKEGKKTNHLTALVPGTDQKFYVVETNSAWQVKDSVFQRIDSFYTRTTQSFQSDDESFGNIYICKIKK